MDAYNQDHRMLRIKTVFGQDQRRITMKKNGDISIEGKPITIKGSGDVITKGQKILQN